MTEVHTQRAHAKLAPSSAYRWMACPGSIRMAGDMDDRPSSYANEGTAAHELAAECLKTEADASAYLGAFVDVENGFISRSGIAASGIMTPDGYTVFEVDEEMVEGVQLYLDTVRSLIPKRGEYELDVEQRLDMTHIHKDIYGTGDVVLYQVAAERLHVLDLKYGKGVAVEPTENPQLMLYGAGAARRYHNRPLKEVVLHIVQPRAPHVRGPVRSWSTDPLALMEWESDLRLAAAKVDEAGTDDFDLLDPLWQKTYLTPGDHCRFCKAAAVCPALREQSMADAMAEFRDGEVVLPESPAKMPWRDVAWVLSAADRVMNWIKAVQEYAHAEATAGRVVPGFKLVPKRAVRKWRDEDEIKDKLLVDLAYSADDIHTTPELKSPAMIEKLLGKKRFAAECAAMVSKVSSGLNLVPESDPREAVKAGGLSEFS
jgi:hypothetical protein